MKMKKIFAVLIVAATMVVGLFADDKFPTGSWIDSRYDAEWRFGLDGSIELYDANTGKLYYTFSKSKISNYKLTPTKDGLTLSFTCSETGRSYKFTKPVSLSTDLILEIDPVWTDENYKTNIKFKK